MIIRKMKRDSPESHVIQLWQDCLGRTDLATEEAGPVKIIYPGRFNDSQGADFRDAVIATSRGVLTGDIEVHVKSSHWQDHRHHRDPTYNRVVLHVVYRDDTACSEMLENGHKVPTLALERLFTSGEKQALSALLPLPCRGSVGRLENMLRIIDRAGEQRFQSRAAGFQTLTSPAEAGQAMYLGIMAALGYASNKHPMTALAVRMPLSELETMVTTPTPAVECLARYQAMLTGMAGLLPSQRRRRHMDDVIHPWAEKLEKIWAASGEKTVMSESDWHFFRVRPGNLPTRRLAAMSYLLLRYRQEGLLTGLMGKLEKAALNQHHYELEEALIIRSGGDRSHHADLNRLFHGDMPALLGKDRAAVIIINVLLPFAVAWWRINSCLELSEKAAGLYRLYPARSMNTLERHMVRQLGLDGKMMNTFRRRQGLLHIFKTYCSEGRCQNCPLAKVA